MLEPSEVPRDWVLGYFGAGEKRGRLRWHRFSYYCGSEETTERYAVACHATSVRGIVAACLEV